VQGRQLLMIPRWIVLSGAALVVAFTALSELRQTALHSPASVDAILTWQVVFAGIVLVWGAAVAVSTVRRFRRPRTSCPPSGGRRFTIQTTFM